jgi:hypothetical protein
VTLFAIEQSYLEGPWHSLAGQEYSTEAEAQFQIELIQDARMLCEPVAYRVVPIEGIVP